MVVLSRQAFDAAGLQTIPIEGPGTSNDTDNRYITAVEPLLSRGALNVFSVHEYDSRRVMEPAGLTLTDPALKSLHVTAPVYVTEFGTASPLWRQAPFKPGADRDSPEFAGNSRDFAISAVGEAFELLAGGASGPECGI